MTRSWLNLCALGVTAIVAGGCDIQAQSPAVDGSFDRTLQVDGPVDLDVFSRSGRIQVRVGPSNAVHIVGRIRAYGSDAWLSGYSPAEQARRLESTPPIEQSANDIRVGHIWDEALRSNVTISYDITVPADTRLRANSRSGEQMIDAVRGPVSASSRSGSIRVEHLVSEIDIATRSGDIDVVGQTSDLRISSRSGPITLEGQPARTWSVETRSGDVNVRLPADGGTQIDFQTRSGGIDSDRPIQMSTARSQKRIQATVGRGGGHLEVRTRSGSLRIR
jgi:putative adhesin